MVMQAMRTFEDKPAVRSRVPLMLGLVGPSGGGKTYSALRLATGIQRVVGGDIFVVDTEARRALHYANLFKFRHVEFRPPFGPLDYLAAIEHCVKKGAGVVVVDSMSHEHEGPGGVLEMHAAETKRLAALWKTSEYAAQMSAWGPPKAERRRMINSILQMPISGIFCFRAKEKLKVEKGKDPKAMGFMPIAGEEFVYEMTMNCLLLPRADGVPTWQSDEIGERMTMKLPAQFRALFGAGGPLTESHGETMARWAEGGALGEFDRLLHEIEHAEGEAALDAIAPKIKAAQDGRTINVAENAALRAAYKRRKEGGPSVAQQNAERMAAASLAADAYREEQAKQEAELDEYNRFRSEKGQPPVVSTDNGLEVLEPRNAPPMREPGED